LTLKCEIFPPNGIVDIFEIKKKTNLLGAMEMVFKALRLQIWMLLSWIRILSIVMDKYFYLRWTSVHYVSRLFYIFFLHHFNRVI